MPIRSFLDTRPIPSQDIISLFNRADELEKTWKAHGSFRKPGQAFDPKVVFCLFLEPSTRTRLSFEMAAYRLGHQVAVMDAGSGSSRVKGESDVDTVANIVAMKPDALVVRYNRSPELDVLLPKLELPVISGGNSTAAHPTQGLLDAYTILRERGKVGGASSPKTDMKGERVLIVGDIVHSRVARSNFDVLSKLGAELAICGPQAWLPPKEELPNVKYFETLDEAIEWPTVYMGLRVQLERHEATDSRLETFNDQFGLNPTRLKKLSSNAMIMHPGPINHGVEFTEDVTSDPRSKVLAQVSNGVLIRAALLSMIFES